MRPSSDDLKNYILSLCTIRSQLPSVFADYGFMNCKDEADKEASVKVYKLYFASKDVDPGELHKACIRGELFLYLRRFVSLVNAPSKPRLLRPWHFGSFPI